jgi:hypothetical protein
MLSVMRLALLAALAACSTVHSEPNDRAPSATKPVAKPGQAAVAEATSCVDDAKPFDVDVMRARLEALADPELDGRAPGTDGDVAARALIAERFRCLGLTTAGSDGYQQAFDDANGKPTANVIGFIKGSSKPEEIILVGAHHDHLGGGFYGANDNASGVVGLLAIAQHVAQLDTKPARTIAFATWGAEEQGLIGSTFFIAHPPSELPLDNIVQYINIDMIGSHASKKSVAAFGAFAKQPSKAILAKLDDGFPKVNLGIGGHSVRGDHHGFCKKNIPYVFFWTPDKRCYHERCDLAENIDYPRMADIAQIAGGLATQLADSATDLVASKKKIGCFGR